jgi:hypothetical protein
MGVCLMDMYLLCLYLTGVHLIVVRLTVMHVACVASRPRFGCYSPLPTIYLFCLGSELMPIDTIKPFRSSAYLERYS